MQSDQVIFAEHHVTTSTLWWPVVEQWWSTIVLGVIELLEEEITRSMKDLVIKTYQTTKLNSIWPLCFRDMKMIKDLAIIQ